MRVRFLTILIIILGCFACEHDPFPAPPEITNLPVIIDTSKPCHPDTVYFDKQILPILASNCAIPDCHSAGSATDGVILDSYENVMATGKVKPGRAEGSKMYKLISYGIFDEDDTNSVMPPIGRAQLSSTEVALIEKWMDDDALDLDCDVCDTADISFLDDILPIFETSCVNSCHSITVLEGGISLTDYVDIKNHTQNGEVLDRINHTPGFDPMPPSGIKLDQCRLDKIDAWVRAGYPDN